MKRIYIVRHGQTYINRYNKMQGWCDTPLTTPGIEGAEEAGRALSEVPFDIAFFALSNTTGKAIVPPPLHFIIVLHQTQMNPILVE